MSKAKKVPLVRIVLDSREARSDRWMEKAIAEELYAAGKLVRAVIYASEVCYVPRRAHKAEVARHFLPRTAGLELVGAIPMRRK